MGGTVGVRRGEEAVQRGTRGAEVRDRSEREVLVLEFLTHGADYGAEVLVVLLRGAREAGEDRRT